MDDKDIKATVQAYYTTIAQGKQQGCCGDSNSCCTPSNSLLSIIDPTEETIIQEADLGLSCGMPTQFARINSGDTVLDLGSGAGVDVLRAARLVGESGKVIGVDMTPDMVARAQQNASNGGFNNVEFRLGDIEALPVEDGSVDVVLSNCVINLLPDKRQAFREIHRVLRPGGHLSISDMVTFGEMPDTIRQDLTLWAGCIAGAIDKGQYLQIIRDCGFDQITIHQEIKYNPFESPESNPAPSSDEQMDFGIASITVEAIRPN
jgi:ubiquinone/menaquinone biosynthesis C-methylase UbiE